MDEQAELLSPAEAAGHIRATRGVRVSAGTVRQWVRHGIRTGSGTVGCAAHRCGGRWYIRAADLETFLDQVQSATLPAFRYTPFFSRELAAA